MLMNGPPTTNNIIVNPTQIYEDRQLKNELETVVQQITQKTDSGVGCISEKFYDIPTSPKKPGRYILLTSS